MDSRFQQLSATRSLPPIPALLLQPPSLPHWGALSRPRLLLELDHVLRQRLAVIAAPAGYGKTVLLSQWATTPRLQAHHHVAWLSLTPYFQDATTLLTGLVAATADMLSDHDLGHLVEHLGDHQEQAHAIAITWLNALARTGVDTILVLDDTHLITTSQTAVDVLTWILMHSPRSLHLVLAARALHSFNALAQLQVQGQVIKLEMTHMRFTPAEVAELYQRVFSQPLLDSQVKKLTDRVDGWPAALALVHQAAQQHGSDAVAEAIDKMGTALPDLYRYLTTVVMSGLPPAEQRFLLTTSLLAQMNPAACGALLAPEIPREEAPAYAQAMLTSLEAHGCFIVRVTPQGTTYRYHDLFRAFLTDKLAETESKSHIQTLHRRAASHFLSIGLETEAISHLLDAEAYDTAIDLIQGLSVRLFRSSRYHLLDRWLNRLPSETIQGNTDLELVRAKLAVLQGAYTQADRRYRALLPALTENSEIERGRRYEATHELAEVTQHLGNFDDAEHWYTEALDLAGDDTQRASILGSLGWCAYMRGRPTDEALALLAQAEALMRSTGDQLGRADILSLQGKLRSSIGDFVEAIEAWKLTTDLRRMYGDRHLRIGLLSRMGYLHLLLGQLDQAEPLIDEAMTLAKRYGRQTSYAYARNIMGTLRRRQGRYEAAHTCHTEALAIQSELDERYEVPVTLNWLGLLARQSGDLAEALCRGEEGLLQREHLGNAYEIGLSLIDVGATHLALGDEGEAAAMWHRALAIFEEARARYEEAQLHIYLAVTATRREDREALLRHLSQGLSIAKTFERGESGRPLYFFVEDAVWIAPTLAAGLQASPSLDYGAHVLAALGQPGRRALVPLLDAADPGTRARAAELLGELQDVAGLKALHSIRRDADPRVRDAVHAAIGEILAATPPSLRIQCLGGFRVWRAVPASRPGLLPEDRRSDQSWEEIRNWGRSSARAILQYLLPHRPVPVPIDQIADAFWPDSDPGAARKNVHQAASALRRALEPELATGMPSRYLAVGDGTYALLLPAGSTVDFEQFEAGLTTVLADPEPAAEDLADALALYRGVYLPDAIYEPWATFMREQLQQLTLQGLQRLASRRLATGQASGAIDAATRILTIDPWQEDAVSILMQGYAQQHKLPAALRAYRQLRERLKQDLDLPPRDDLNRLYEELRGRRSGRE